MDRGVGLDDNPLRKYWIPWIMTDPVLFQLTMTLSAIHMIMRQGAQDQQYIILQKMTSIKLINERIDSQDDPTDNSIIGAIAMMAAIEVCGISAYFIKIAILFPDSF